MQMKTQVWIRYIQSHQRRKTARVTGISRPGLGILTVPNLITCSLNFKNALCTCKTTMVMLELDTFTTVLRQGSRGNRSCEFMLR